MLWKNLGMSWHSYEIERNSNWKTWMAKVTWKIGDWNHLEYYSFIYLLSQLVQFKGWAHLREWMKVFCMSWTFTAWQLDSDRKFPKNEQQVDCEASPRAGTREKTALNCHGWFFFLDTCLLISFPSYGCWSGCNPCPALWSTMNLKREEPCVQGSLPRMKGKRVCFLFFLFLVVI